MTVDEQDRMLIDRLASSEFRKAKKVEQEELKTLEFIKMLQKEDEQEVQKIRKLEDDEQQKEFNCKICMEFFEDDEENELPFCLTHCENVFHENCLKTYLELQIKDAKLPILCPDAACKVEIADGDLKDLLPMETYQKYTDFALNHAVDNQNDISWCPTADCQYAFVFNANDGEDSEEAQLHCPMCAKHYCLNCRVLFHEGMSCKEYQVDSREDANDLAFMKMVKGKKFKQCTKCKYFVEKSMGCNSMRCRCGRQFCYKCGTDQVGGCECVKKAQANALARNQKRKAAAAKRKLALAKKMPKKREVKQNEKEVGIFGRIMQKVWRQKDEVVVAPKAKKEVLGLVKKSAPKKPALKKQATKDQ